MKTNKSIASRVAVIGAAFMTAGCMTTTTIVEKTERVNPDDCTIYQDTVVMVDGEVKESTRERSALNPYAKRCGDENLAAEKKKIILQTIMIATQAMAKNAPPQERLKTLDRLYSVLQMEDPALVQFAKAEAAKKGLSKEEIIRAHVLYNINGLKNPKAEAMQKQGFSRELILLYNGQKFPDEKVLSKQLVQEGLAEHKLSITSVERIFASLTASSTGKPVSCIPDPKRLNSFTCR